jgi:carboxylesterase
MAQATKTPAILGQVKCPLLVLHSKGDRAASPAATEEAFPLFGSQDKKIVWYERSNHHLLWDYEEVEVKAQILDFVKPLY